MNGIYDEETTARVRHVVFTETSFTVEFLDRPEITRPLDWFPRLAHGTPSERDHWRLIADGYGINWPDLDEDISADNIIRGQRSMECETSFQAWLDRRPDGRRSQG